MAAAATPERPRPVAGVDYPGNLVEFFDWFQSDDECWRYLVRLRWPDGFRCSACGHSEAWLTARRVFICTSCRKRVSVLKGTLFERSQLPLLDWFRAAWLMASQKRGVSASSIRIDLGLGSYKTAWTLEHNLRRAMMHRGQAKLTGEIEVDETFVGGHRESDKSKGDEGRVKRGRGAPGKTFVAIAVEAPTHYRGLGRVRMRIIPDFHKETLEDFVTDTCARGSVIYTDGNPAYGRLRELGYEHVVKVIRGSNIRGHDALPGVHRVASLLKRWLLGTHQGSVARQHLESYLEEFTFRFNRRRSGSRGWLFYTLLKLALVTPPRSYDTIVWSRRGLRDPDAKLRGVEPRTPVPPERRRARPRRTRGLPRSPRGRGGVQALER